MSRWYHLQRKRKKNIVLCHRRTWYCHEIVKSLDFQFVETKMTLIKKERKIKYLSWSDDVGLDPWSMLLFKI